jgi:hypothetical protein
MEIEEFRKGCSWYSNISGLQNHESYRRSNKAYFGVIEIYMQTEGKNVSYSVLIASDTFPNKETDLKMQRFHE